MPETALLPARLASPQSSPDNGRSSLAVKGGWYKQSIAKENQLVTTRTSAARTLVLDIGGQRMIAAQHASLRLLMFLPFLLAACSTPRDYEPVGRQSIAAGPGAAVRSNWNGDFSCTAHIDGKLPAITWRRIPFRQEGDRVTGLYNFTDHFSHQNSVMFSGTLSGQNGRVDVTAVRTSGSPNFTAEMTGSRALMTGRMMSGVSRRPVRSCTLALSAARL
jgi:hypothetical protein